MIKFESEHELETFILKNPQVLPFLNTKDKPILLNQFAVGDYGIIDIIAITKQTDTVCDEYHIDLIELKNVPIGLDAIKQICRYMQAIDDIAPSLEIALSSTAHLICLDDNLVSSCMYVTDRIEDLKYYTYKIDPIEGFSIESHSGCHQSGAEFSKVINKFNSMEELFKIGVCDEVEDEN